MNSNPNTPKPRQLTISEVIRKRNDPNTPVNLHEDFFGQSKPSFPLRPPKPHTTLDSLLRQTDRPQVPRALEKPLAVLPKPDLSKYISKKSTQTSHEEDSLKRLQSWMQTLKGKPEPHDQPVLPTKRPAETEDQPAILAKRPASRKPAKPESFSLDSFMAREEEKQQQRKKAAQEQAVLQRKMREDMYNEVLGQPADPEQLRQRMRACRLQRRHDLSELYDFVLNINPRAFARVKCSPIPAKFADGEEYIKAFQPAFFNEVQAYVKSALEQADFNKTSMVKGTYKPASDGFTWVTVIEDIRKEHLFLQSAHNEDLLLLYPAATQPPKSYDMWTSLKCNSFIGVCEKHPTTHAFQIRIKAENSVYFTRSAAFCVTFLERLTTILREFKMIRGAEFTELGEQVLTPLLQAEPVPLQLPPQFFERLQPNFNHSQLNAIQATCQQSAGITLLQGPPGTGKTHTLLGLLSAFRLQPSIGAKPRILVCAPSNTAINEIVSRVLQRGLYAADGTVTTEFSCVRLGSTLPDKPAFLAKQTDFIEPNDLVKSVTLHELIAKSMRADGLVDKASAIDSLTLKLAKTENALSTLRRRPNSPQAEITRLEQTVRGLRNEITREKYVSQPYNDKRKISKQTIITKADIVFATLSGSACEELLSANLVFDYVVVDEACQSVEPSTLIPFQHGARHVVLIGDPMQLPATTFAHSSERTHYTRSLFERLMLGGMPVTTLTVQYRMTREISEFSSTHFYHGALVPAPEVEHRRTPSWVPASALLFVDWRGGSESRSENETSVFNKSEAELVAALLSTLASRDRRPKSIGVITPYRRQVRLIKERLQKGLRQVAEVNTVDGFQGREKDLIVFSCVRTKRIGFLADYRRLNVAVTRARFGLIIIGNADVLRSSTHWNNLINYLQSKDLVVTASRSEEVVNRLGKSTPEKPPLLQTPSDPNSDVQFLLGLLTKKK